jgi:hypothetical protein
MVDLLDDLIAKLMNGNRAMAAEIIDHVIHYRNGLITAHEMAEHIDSTLHAGKADREYTPLNLDDMRPLSEGSVIGNNGESDR